MFSKSLYLSLLNIASSSNKSRALFSATNPTFLYPFNRYSVYILFSLSNIVFSNKLLLKFGLYTQSNKKLIAFSI